MFIFELHHLHDPGTFRCNGGPSTTVWLRWGAGQSAVVEVAPEDEIISNGIEMEDTGRMTCDGTPVPTTDLVVNLEGIEEMTETMAKDLGRIDSLIVQIEDTAKGTTSVKTTEVTDAEVTEGTAMTAMSLTEGIVVTEETTVTRLETLARLEAPSSWLEERSEESSLGRRIEERKESSLEMKEMIEMSESSLGSLRTILTGPTDGPEARIESQLDRSLFRKGQVELVKLTTLAEHGLISPCIIVMHCHLVFRNDVRESRDYGGKS